MINSIILILLIIVALFEHNSASNFSNGVIYNGEIFNTEDYPYIMYVTIFVEPEHVKPRMSGKCTGTLIHALFVLTAARCVYGKDKSLIKVQQGPQLEFNEKHDIVKMHFHKTYKGEIGEYNVVVRGDICLLQLKFAVPYIKTFMKIGGSPKDFENNKKLKCTIFGFGKTGKNDTSLGYMMTNDVVHGKTACEKPDSKRIKDSWQEYLCLIPNSGSAPCLGDSGGPMICKGKQYGLYSFRFSYASDGWECGNPNQQYIYTFIYYHLKWLNNIIKPKNEENRSFGNILKPRHTWHTILLVILYNVLPFI